MNKIPAICIDDTKKPEIIPDSLWVKKGNQYHIIHIYKMVNQDNIQGCELKELDISSYIPYNCFRLSRFAFRKEDLDNLIELMKLCTELDSVKIDELVQELEVYQD